MQRRTKMNAKWTLSRHEHYKQLCVLASLGELPADEGRKLRRHLADCEQCGQAYSDYLALRVGLIPHSDDAGTIAALKESTRAAVLHGIVDLEQRGTASPRKPETGVARPLWNQTLPLFGSAVALAAVAVCCFWLGMRYQSLRNVASAGRLQIQIPAVPAPTPATQSESTETSVRQEQFSKAFHREHEHNVQLRAALEEKENHLLATEEQNATLQHRIAVETKELSATESLLWSKSTYTILMPKVAPRGHSLVLFTLREGPLSSTRTIFLFNVRMESPPMWPGANGTGTSPRSGTWESWSTMIGDRNAGFWTSMIRTFWLRLTPCSSHLNPAAMRRGPAASAC